MLVSRPAIGGSAGRLQLSSGIAAAMQAPMCWVPPPRLFFPPRSIMTFTPLTRRQLDGVRWGSLTA